LRAFDEATTTKLIVQPPQNALTAAAEFPAAFLFPKGYCDAEPPFHRVQSINCLAGAGHVSRDLSHAAEIVTPARVLFISGQFGVAPDGKLRAEFAAQCEQAMDNVEALLAAAGMAAANIIRLTYYVTRAADFPALVQVRQRRWAFDPAPSVTALAVSALARPEYLIEIEAIAIAALEQGR
jgi:2-iminobutanoate/2-iminopropanoate deaminase